MIMIMKMAVTIIMMMVVWPVAIKGQWRIFPSPLLLFGCHSLVGEDDDDDDDDYDDDNDDSNDVSEYATLWCALMCSSQSLVI